MSAALARLRERAERLGVPGVIGITLIAFCVTAWASTLLPAYEALRALEKEADKAQRRTSTRSQAIAPLNAAVQLETFYAFFPGATSTPEWLGRIHALAARAGLTLATGEYTVARASLTRLMRYEMTLPVEGTYPQVRGFLSAVLAEIPAAVVEEVSLKRESADAARIQARLRITLYLGLPPSRAAGA